MQKGDRSKSAASVITSQNSTKASLRSASSEIVAEYLGGGRPEFEAKRWPEQRALLLDQLLQRCPGFSTREYRTALKTRLLVRGVAAQLLCAGRVR